MSHLSINLKLYKIKIISLFQNNDSSAFITNLLQNKYNFKVRERMIKSCLKEWGIQKQNYIIISDTILYTQIKILFFEINLEEKKLFYTLQNKEFEIIS